MEQMKAYGRSLSDFVPLMLGEQELLNACNVGAVAVLGNGVPTLAKNNKVVRAEFIRFLLLGGDQKVPVHERGIFLQGGFIFGTLDLSGCHIKFHVSLRNCRFNHQVNAVGAKIDGGIDLEGSFLAEGLNANYFFCAENVVLSNGFKATAKLSFLSAKINGDFNCSGGIITAKESLALSADGIDIGGNAFFSNGFKAEGEVGLLDSPIGCSLICAGGQFKGGFGLAISADRIRVKGSVFLNDGFKAVGEVRLLGAQIDSNLSCKNSHFENLQGDALNANRANIKGSVFISNAFNAIGTVNFVGARIGGSFECSRGNFNADQGQALVLNRANINGSVFFDGTFKAIGKVNLIGAKIGGNLSCSGGKFNVQKGNALTLNRATINGTAFVNNGIDVVGAVSFIGATVGGDLNFSRGKFVAKSGCDLILRNSIIRGVLYLDENPAPVRINASHAEVVVLMDKVKCWAKGSIIDGFRYTSLGGSSADIGKIRMKWLRKQHKMHLKNKNFKPQPWRQLQRVLREMGHTEDSKQVGVEFEEHLRKIGRVGQSAKGTNFIFAWWRRIIARGLHRVFGILAAYGYRPIRLLTWMLAVWLVCGAAYWYFALSPSHRAIAPTAPLIFQDESYIKCQPDQPGPPRPPANWYLCDDLRSEYSTFSPLAYSMDVMLPVVNLGQETAWGAFIPAPKENWREELFTHWTSGHYVRLINWFQILFGWVSSLLLVAIISGFSRRNDEG